MLERTPLHELFAPADLEAWRELAQQALGEKPLSRLGSRTADDIEVQPLYAAENSAMPPNAAWAGRADGVVLCGVERIGPGLVDRLHDAAHGGMQAVLLRGSGPLGVAETSLPLLLECDGPAASCVGVPGANLGRDPFAAHARGMDLDFDASLEWFTRAGEDVRVFALDPTAWHDAGATSAQQLGALFAASVDLLREAEKARLPLAEVVAKTDLRVRLDARFFEGIALLRALRWGWAQIASELELSTKPRVHAISSTRMNARRDPWVNLLRHTAACFAGLVGGADLVSCESYDEAFGEPSDAGRRLAHNTLLLLTEESHLHRVFDPSAGSWYLESLTRELGEKAWGFFQQIEDQGGMGAALRSGWLREQVDVSWERERAAVAKRKQAITGVSEFPWLGEPSREAAAVEPAGPWPVRRPAADFEALRDASDAHLARTGARPKVHLLTWGRGGDFNARATWCRNFFEAGGFEVESGEKARELEAALRDYRGSDAKVVVLCSSDANYETGASDAVRGLREAGARTVILAGRGDFEGVDRGVFLGCDVLGTLRELQAEEGVAR